MSTGNPIRPSLSVVLPAYNEEAVIAQTVLHVDTVVRGLADDYEIIVTDDGSTDRTGAELARIQREHPEIPLLVVTTSAIAATAPPSPAASTPPRRTSSS